LRPIYSKINLSKSLDTASSTPQTAADMLLENAYPLPPFFHFKVSDFNIHLSASEPLPVLRERVRTCEFKMLEDSPQQCRSSSQETSASSGSSSSFEDEYFKLPVSLYSTIFSGDSLERLTQTLDDLLSTTDLQLPKCVV
jgi:hypothetical protein